MIAKIPRRLAQIGKRHHTTLLMPLIAAIAISNGGGVPTSQAAINTSQVGSGFTVTVSDLAYILQQIKIAEFHAANTTSLTGLCGALVGSGPHQIPSPLLSLGLRTVDGSCNNLQPGQEVYGAADQAFPRLTTPNFGRSGEPAPQGFPPGGDYSQTTGFVYDSQPRMISNLIVDQTSTNPAARFVAEFPARTQGNEGVVPCVTEPTTPGGTDGIPAGCVPQFQTLFIPNVTTDVGLSPPYNSLFTIFGQFFDHGLDKITNGGNGQVFVPLKADDPLVAGADHIFGTPDDLAPNLRFMPLTRGTIKNDPVTGIRSAPNTDSPFVDQSQTYTSHSSHQVFLREYVLNAGKPAATGKFLSDAAGGIATWAMIKDQAATKLGLLLTDVDATNIPMILADQYGNFIPGPNGLPQYMTTTGTGLVEGDLASPVAAPADVVRIETAFLNDISHSADPGTIASPKTPDANTTPGNSLDQVAPGEYDNELLDLHFICGDGRCNENIALTAVHQIFHMEHDRLVDYFINPNDGVLTRPENAALLADFQAVDLRDEVTPGVRNPNKTFTFEERLFQAARFVTEMQYQHLVFEEFARKVQPAINPFQPFAFNQTDLNSAITAEFAHAVYRFGHSMLTDTIPRLNDPSSVLQGAPLHNDISLFDGFLNPAAFNNGGNGVILDAHKATGAIIMGLSDQIGNELDEFVADTLRNRLLGLPLDLPSINMARARSEGIPSLNNVRKQIFAKTNDGQLAPYANWIDFDQGIKHHVSLVNFIAAYGRHPTILAATTSAGKRAAAEQIVNGTTIADAGDFLFGVGTWAGKPTGVDDIDLWVGGLAEKTNLFGGLLGSTFNYVFEKQMTDLQNGDRMYYLARTPGMNLRTQLEGNSFAELVMRNTNPYTHTLKADPFATADCKFELANLHSPYLPGTDPVPVSSTLVPPLAAITGAGSVNDDPASECDENQLLLHLPNGAFRYRELNGVDPAGINGQSVYNGTEFADVFYGGNDNDTFWGGLGNDIIEGGGGDDVSLGGEGDDIITDFAGADLLKGGPGNDAIDGGIGDDIIMSGDGKDFTNGGANINETFAGPGDDFSIAGQGEDAIFGDSGDDWEEGGDMPDLLIGDSSSLFFDDHNLPGHDILIGQSGDDDYDMEGGDDIGVSGPGVEKIAGAAGYDWEIGLGDPQAQDMDLALPLLGVPLPVNGVRDRFNEVEALSGWKFNDTLRGDSIVPSAVTGGGFIGCDALDADGVARIAGLDALVTPAMRTVDPAPIAAAASTNYCGLTGLVWGEGNILLGGDGSDTLEGRGANDILDGDRYLNVRLSVRTNPVDPATEIGSTNLMENLPVTGSFGADPQGNPMTLQQAVFAGKVNPGNIVAVREILTPTVPAADCGATTPLNCDTALFSGPNDGRYTINLNADGSLTVSDTTGVDGTDTLWNIEQLSFCLTPGAVRGTCDVRAVDPVSVATLFAPAASVSATSLAFGNQVVLTTSATQAIRVTNTGATNLVVSGVTTTGANAADFLLTNGCTSPVTPGSSCDVSVQFRPTTTGAVSANVSITHNAAGSSSSVLVSGTGIAPPPVATIAPASLAFGNQVVLTTSATQAITVTNTGASNLVVTGATMTGVNAADFLLTNGCTTVIPGGSCTVSVQFRPATTGVEAANVSITHNAGGSSSSVTVSGTGIAPPPVAAIGPASLAFGNQVVLTTSATRAVTVTNTGASNLVVSGVTMTGANAASFLLTNGCTNPVIPGGSCTVNVQFRPATAGAKAANVSITHNAAGSSSSVSVSGTGTVAPSTATTTATIANATIGGAGVRVGTAVAGNVRVTNTGTAPLVITSVTATAPFAVTRGTCTTPLRPGRSCNLRVTFRPTAVRQFTGTLTLASNARNNPRGTLTGRGR